MMGRNRRYARANNKVRATIATAVLVGGGAIGVVALTTASHGSTPVAQSAGFITGFSHNESEWSALDSAVSGSGVSDQTYRDLGSVGQMTFSQTTAHQKTLDVQRGIVVLATSRFVILRSSNGALHLWVLSGRTKVKNVSESTMGATAMTASSTAGEQAVSGDMATATSLLAGTTQTAAQLVNPSAAPQTTTVQIAGTDLTVTITVTGSSASVSQTATVPTTDTNPFADPTTSTVGAFTGSMAGLARGDLAVIAGTRSHGLLHAQLVLFVPLSTSDVGGLPFHGHHGATPTPSATATATATPTPSASATEAGLHW
jgi:hypothetical protein